MGQLARHLAITSSDESPSDRAETATDHSVYQQSITQQWRDVLETVINRRKLTDAQANPSTQRKRYLSPI